MARSVAETRGWFPAKEPQEGAELRSRPSGLPPHPRAGSCPGEEPVPSQTSTEPTGPRGSEIRSVASGALPGTTEWAEADVLCFWKKVRGKPALPSAQTVDLRGSRVLLGAP